MRSVSVFIAAIIALSMTVHAEAASSRSRQKAEPPPPPPQFKVDVATRTMTLARVASSIPNGVNIGEFSPGGCGLFRNAKIPPLTLHSEDAFRGSRQEDYMNVFTREAGAAGYTLLTSQQGNLFADKEESKAELAVGLIGPL